MARLRSSLPFISALTLVGGLFAAGVPSATAQDPAWPTVTISSNRLSVDVATGFPSVVRYVDRASGARLDGQPDPVASVVLNGKEYAAEAAVETEEDAAHYTLTFAELPDVEIDADLTVEHNVVTFALTEVRDTEAFRVGTIEIPGQDLISVTSKQAGATAATTRIDVDSTRNADKIRPVTAEIPTGAAAGATYAILSTDKLAATVETNGTYDQPANADRQDATRLWEQVTADADGAKRLGIRAGQWTYRGLGSPTTSELPWAKVVVTGDANRDQVVDWQDGAIAYRSITSAPAGAEKTADRVIQHIPFNFASLATHPFLRTLDDVKRLSRATDGLGQLAILKGYGSEGHDSAHPDYGGNYNERAGGLDDLNLLLEKGEKWGADFGVHVNATESYPEANAFDETLVDKTKKGWNWLNQSYYIDQRRDLNSGDLTDRFQQLRDETHENLELLYIDVYYTYGWLPDETNRRLRAMGWQVGTEWADHMERNSLWSHWATDRNYGGATNKGINSQIIRFIRNTEKDVWNPHPILGSSTIVEAEGWTGQHDWNALMANVWRNQVPTKFLQHFKIDDWAEHEIKFDDGVRGTDTDGVRRLYAGDAEVLTGDAYLLPWGKRGPQQPDKLYHYNHDGGATTWKLTAAFRQARSLAIYELSDTGRRLVKTVKPVNGKVTLDAKPGTAYVVYPETAPTPLDPQWGEGTPVADPGFNAGNLGAWSPQGKVSATTSSNGAHEATFGAGAGSLSQQLRGLEAGTTYAASAWVEVAPGATRTATIEVTGGGVDAKRAIERSTLPNVVASDEREGTSFQRIRVLFTAPDDAVRLRISAGAGSAAVRVDDVRVVATDEQAPAGGVVAQQDFEDVDQGWLPFVSGPAQEGGDGRTHVTKKHAPYTQAGWNGKLVDNVLDGDWSLKAHEQGTGIIYRTHQGSLRFEPGHRYRVEFDYANAYADSHAWVVGVDQARAGGFTPQERTSTTLPEQRGTGHFSEELVAPTCGDTWIGLKGLPAGGAEDDFILDNLVVTDLGASTTPGACAREEIGGLSHGLVPGEVNRVTTRFTNLEQAAVTDVTQSFTAPAGWTVEAATPDTFATVAAGATVATTWDVTVPAGTEPGSYDVSAAASYTLDGGTRSLTTRATARTLPPGLIPQSRLAIHGVSDADDATGGPASAAIDGDSSTMWHSAWSQVEPDAPYPHWISLDLGAAYDVKGLDYQVRIGNGAIKDYEVYVSTDGTTWGSAVKTGSFASTTGVQHLDLPATRGRYVKLVGLNAVNGRAFAGAGEINVWGSLVAQAVPLPKDGMSIASVDSEETEGEDGAAANLLDGDPSTFWHTEWLNQEAPYPHQVTVDLGATYQLDGLLHTGRPGAEPNGRIKEYEVLLSADGTTWGAPVASGSLTASAGAQRIAFPSAEAQYVRFVAKSSHNGAAFAAIAELDFLAPA